MDTPKINAVFLVIVLSSLIGGGGFRVLDAEQAPALNGISATRIPQNPLITVTSSNTLGDNVNGPSIITSLPPD